jgi:hypothetical protein
MLRLIVHFYRIAAGDLVSLVKVAAIPSRWKQYTKEMFLERCHLSFCNFIYAQVKYIICCIS